MKLAWGHDTHHQDRLRHAKPAQSPCLICRVNTEPVNVLASDRRELSEAVTVCIRFDNRKQFRFCR